GKPPPPPAETASGTPATKGFAAPVASADAREPRAVLPALLGASGARRPVESMSARLNALLTRPQQRPARAHRLLAEQPMLRQHPLVPGSMPTFMPHRPPRPEKSEGGIAFKLVADYEPRGDQPTAIAELVDGVNRLERDQVLLGVTGSGKTFTAAQVIAHT